jgi:hypothetical protein
MPWQARASVARERKVSAQLAGEPVSRGAAEIAELGLRQEQNGLQKSRIVCKNSGMVWKKAGRSAQRAECCTKKQDGLLEEQNGLQKHRMVCENAESSAKTRDRLQKRRMVCKNAAIPRVHPWASRGD